MSNEAMDNRHDPPRPLKVNRPAVVTMELKCHMVASSPSQDSLTLCGIPAGPGPLSITGDRDAVTCNACVELLG